IGRPCDRSLLLRSLRLVNCLDIETIRRHHMPVPDTTPARKLVIRRGLIRYIVDEAKYDTVQIEDADGTTGTYKSLGYLIVSAIENGEEVPYVKREHVDNVPVREDVTTE